MKILVTSDTHGCSNFLERAIRTETGFDMLIHLGDGERDVHAVRPLLEGRPFLQVRGNCDLASDLPLFLVTEEGGKRLFCTHGHEQYVKYGTQILAERARSVGADIALYGHTHVQVQEYIDGMYILNPGALVYRQYAVLEIVPQGVMWLPTKF